MNERYLFRGKRIDNGEWVEGYYFCFTHPDARHDHHFINPLGTDLSKGRTIEDIQVEVDPATVGQCTGLRDKNMKLIFEGDIVIDSRAWEGVVEWMDDGRWMVVRDSHHNCERYVGYVSKEPAIQIIGNVHDTPELVLEYRDDTLRAERKAEHIKAKKRAERKLLK